MKLQKFKSAIPITGKLQVSQIQQKKLEKQAYRMVGHHSSVKVCGWTKNMLLKKGGCYKFAFYGIRSHQCMQMTTSMYCGSRCAFCWRGQKAPVATEWYGEIDDPDAIINHASEEHIGLLAGYKNNPKSEKAYAKDISNIKHVALSLTGEPITYPKMNEILESFHKRKISTFLVTNAQYPQEMKKINYVTQLYLSIDAPNMEILKKVDRPLYTNFYERMLQCLDILATRTYRTCIRLTMIKDLNMEDIKGYAELIKRGSPDFLEVKGYMHVGASRLILKGENMPSIEEVEIFTEKLMEELPEYEYVQKHDPSVVCLCLKKSLEKKKWIDFGKFFEIANNKQILQKNSYNAKKICPN